MIESSTRLKPMHCTLGSDRTLAISSFESVCTRQVQKSRSRQTFFVAPKKRRHYYSSFVYGRNGFLLEALRFSSRETRFFPGKGDSALFHFPGKAGPQNSWNGQMTFSGLAAINPDVSLAVLTMCWCVTQHGNTGGKLFIGSKVLCMF